MRFPLVAGALFAALGLAGCQFRTVADPSLSKRDIEWMALTPQAEIDPGFARYEVDDTTGEKPGTVIVDTKERQLYYVLPNRRAIRYGVVVGDEAFGWSAHRPQGRMAGLR
jgi:lipoprotein-anchoring transpeptidase ErfK/SrfK